MFFRFMLPAVHFHSSWFCPHTCTEWECGGTVRAIKPETTRDFLLNSGSPQYCLTPSAYSADLESVFCDSHGKIDGASAQKSMQILCHSNARKPWGGSCFEIIAWTEMPSELSEWIMLPVLDPGKNVYSSCHSLLKTVGN